jgi:hypothetical protein
MHHAITTEIEIDAPPNDVWAALTDLDGYAEWNPFITEAAGEVKVGERLTNRLQPPGERAMTFRPEVTVVEPNETFEWLGHLGVSGVFDGRHRFELTELPDGRTRLVQSEQFSGLLVRPMRKRLDGGTVAGFEAMNEALAAHVTK